MLMKKAQVISDVSVVKEYFIDGVHGRSVPIADAKAVEKVIADLQDGEQLQKYGNNAYQYAKKYFTNDVSSKRMVDILLSSQSGKKLDTCHPEWLKEYELLRG